MVDGSGRGLVVHDRGGSAPRTFTLSGELDAHRAPELEADLLAHVDDGEIRLLLDVEGLTFLDSTGLRALLAVEERCRAEGGWVNLVRPSPAVRTVLEITDLEDRFRSHT